MAEGIRLEQRKARIGFAKSEMRKVISDKRQHDQAAHHHVTRSEGCFDIAPVDIGLRPGAPVLNG